MTLSGIPMVGYRNHSLHRQAGLVDFIRHSDGGVSEPRKPENRGLPGLYQAFRWWGIGTARVITGRLQTTLSGIPMVGYRNQKPVALMEYLDFIRHSDGGVSERPRAAGSPRTGLYQAFRWWGIGTVEWHGQRFSVTLSGIPMVGYRN